MSDTVMKALAAMHQGFDGKLTAAEEKEYAVGYTHAYHRGRAKDNLPDLKYTSDLFRAGVYQGYKDGRGHRAKKYK
jgi:hypothetical protein